MKIEDITRLNYIKYTAFRPLVQNPHSIFYCVCRFLLQIIWFYFKRRKGDMEMRELFFVVPSHNNLKSVKTILDSLPEEKCTVWDLNLPYKLPLAKISTLSLLYLHLFFKLYLSSSTDDRKLIRFYYWDFITACATYKVFEKALKNNHQLKMVVMANDHVLITRCLIELTEKLHIRSLYVQHASVSTAFPPLRFDYSFLDGMESYEKYKKIGNIRGKIFLSGSPRFDAFHNYNGGDKNYDIGIALNELDSEKNALDLCLYLKAHYSDKIIVRPHPNMLAPGRLMFHEEKFIEHGFAISDPRKDLSYVFLAEIKVMVANESGIHLDAAMMSVPSILYNFSGDDVRDWYSYIKKGLIKKCDTFDEVVKMLTSSYNTPVDVVRYYAASYMTSMDGKVGEMIASFIKKVVYESDEMASSFIDGLMINQGDYAEYCN